MFKTALDQRQEREIAEMYPFTLAVACRAIKETGTPAGYWRLIYDISEQRNYLHVGGIRPDQREYRIIWPV